MKQDLLEHMEIMQSGTEVRHAGAKPPRRLSPAKAYALWAQTYDRNPNPLLALEERELLPLLPILRGTFVLDVACGTGRWLRKLLELGARQAAGFDLSREMLDQARRKQGLRDRLFRADCTAIPISTGAVDLALCSFATGYVADLGRLASELSRVVRFGGGLILTDLHPAGINRGWRRTFRHDGDVVEILNFHYPTDHLCAVFREHGFKLEHISCPYLGEAERVIFQRYEKEHLFEEARSAPAIFICYFRLGDL